MIGRLWEFRSIPHARAFFACCSAWAMRSRPQPMRYLAWLLLRYRSNILTYLTHRITNAGIEELNAKIQWIKYSRVASGPERFKLAIYFHCGGLLLDSRV